MKTLKYSFLILAAALFLGACEKESEGISQLTYFCELTLLGDSPYVIEKGTTYVDPGYTATENDEDVSDAVVVTGTVNTNTPGIYTLSYSVKNKDGFPKTDQRQVFVVDHTSLASAYFGESYLNDARHYYDAPIIIKANNDNTYTIDDLVGGFQFWGLNPGFEPTYDFHFETVLELQADNSITAKSYGSWYGAFPVPSLISGAYNPATGVVTLRVQYSTSIILVTLTK
jgi:hypothetical protein